QCTESKAKSCSDCISVPGCAWCEDSNYANNPNVLISRCDLPENLLTEGERCPENAIINPKSNQSSPGGLASGNRPHSNVGESAVGTATQIRPQIIKAQVRPGDPLNIELSFKQAEDYPVDLYYLLDLSKSMENDLNSLRALGRELGMSMQNITRDFRLGFGSFIDKTVMPYISTVPAKIKNPCSDKAPCVPTYSFHNDLPLTPEIEAFVTSVNNVTHSSNLDNPEGGLDAMMQAIVCKESINWRKDATHLLVYSTDASFHYAGDGKLGGIVLPNDGRCYLNSKGHYYNANYMDYPSIGHLVRKITSHSIQPIFAVTSNVIQTYTNLQKMIPKSVVGELSGDSSNIQLIQDAYNDTERIRWAPIHWVTGVACHPCYDVGTDSLGHRGGICLIQPFHSQVNFTFTLSTEKCLTSPVQVIVSPYGYNEVVTINVESLCDCQCEETEAPTNNCSGHGNYQCGSCVCESGFTGLDCSCDQKDVLGIESYLANCTDPTTGVVCNRGGECQCGSCICTQYANKKIDGKYCECDNTSCKRAGGKVCNGTWICCDCGDCICEPGWKGKACECTLEQALCYDHSDDALDSTKPCNGNGECECGQCVCKLSQGGAKFRGQYCETKPLVVCDIHRDCIQCAWHTGNYNDTECKTQCMGYNVTVVSGNKQMHRLKHKKLINFYNVKLERVLCDIYSTSPFCPYYFDYVMPGQYGLSVLFVQISEFLCKTYANPVYIIIGIIAAIVGIGLAILLIWKLLTSIKDAREYKNFQKESQNPKWQGGENPIFKKATSTFKNPMYSAGK
uniref:Integrin beta n=1 Tax=Ciona savignyi TaxID=51511 RepID=H2YJU2_CIOSA